MKIPFRQAGLLILLFAFSFNLYAQSDSVKIDSLKKILQTQKEDSNKVNTLNELSIAFSQTSDVKKSRQNAIEALALSEKINFEKGSANAHSLIGYSYMFSPDQNYIQALKSFNEALKIRIKINDKKG